MRNGKYELVIAPDKWPGKKYRERYCYEHHLVFWLETGVIPNKFQCIHHKNSDTRDNRFENLEIVSRSEHSFNHTSSRGSKYVRLRCPACGEIFTRSRNKTHLVLKKSVATFCSSFCSGRFANIKFDISENVIEEFIRYL